MAGQECPNCGMNSEMWEEPYEKGGKEYCCEGCAENNECTCDVPGTTG